MFLFISFNALATAALERLLYLDQIKSAKFQEFSEGLSKLEAETNSLPSFERDFMTLLIAYRYAYEGEREKSLELIKPLIEGADPTLSFRGKALAINTLLTTKRYLDAFLYFEQLIRQLNNIQQPTAREHGLRVISLMYNMIGRFDVSLDYLDQLIAAHPSPNSVCAAYQLKVEALFFSERVDEFLKTSAEGQNYCRGHNEPLWENLIVTFIARHYISNELYHDAIKLLEEKYKAAELTRYTSLLAEFNSLLAQSYSATGQLENARKLALKVVEMSQGAIYLATVDSLKILYQLEKQAGNYQQALGYHEQYLAAFTAYMDDKSAQQLAYHTAHSEVLAQNQKIALLDKDNQLLQHEQAALRHQATINKLLIAGLILLIVGLLFLAYRSFIARQRFKALAENDDLTAISNRYHFSASAKKALALCEKGQLPASLVVFDLDYFKQINDKYGHAAGDWALRRTVEVCRNFLRSDDVFGRIGGEEFAILLPNCQSDKAYLVADICRDAIYQIDTEASGYSFKLSASFGIASTQISGYHLTKLVEDADTAMYQAKQQGRNRVQVF